MHFNKKPGKIFNPAALILILFAVLMLGFSAAPTQAKGSKDRQEINLNKEQRDRLQRHIEQNKGEVADVRRQIQAARSDLSQQLRQYDVDERKVQQTIRRINDLQTRLQLIHLENQVKLRDILTKEQFADLREAVGSRGMDGDEVHAWPERDGPHARNVQNLDLSEQQQDRINKLFQRSTESMNVLIRKAKGDAGSLRELYLSYSLDTKRAKEIINRLSNTRLEILKTMVDRQVELRNILTKKQFEALAKSMPGHGGGSGKGRGRR